MRARWALARVATPSIEADTAAVRADPLAVTVRRTRTDRAVYALSAGGARAAAAIADAHTGALVGARVQEETHLTRVARVPLLALAGAFGALSMPRAAADALPRRDRAVDSEVAGIAFAEAFVADASSRAQVRADARVRRDCAVVSRESRMAFARALLADAIVRAAARAAWRLARGAGPRGAAPARPLDARAAPAAVGGAASDLAGDPRVAGAAEASAVEAVAVARARVGARSRGAVGRNVVGIALAGTALASAVAGAVVGAAAVGAVLAPEAWEAVACAVVALPLRRLSL